MSIERSKCPTDEALTFVKKFKKRGFDQAARLAMLAGEPTAIAAVGLPEIKQIELGVKWRPNVPVEFQDDICPVPPKEMIDRVKKQKNEKQKKRKTGSAKKKKTGEGQESGQRVEHAVDQQEPPPPDPQQQQAQLPLQGIFQQPQFFDPAYYAMYPPSFYRYY
jgi:hypothetical protein